MLFFAGKIGAVIVGDNSGYRIAASLGEYSIFSFPYAKKECPGLKLNLVVDDTSTSGTTTSAGVFRRTAIDGGAGVRP